MKKLVILFGIFVLLFSLLSPQICYSEKKKPECVKDNFEKFLGHIVWREYEDVVYVASSCPSFVNKKDDYGMTPLMYSVFIHDDDINGYKIVKYLLGKGAGVNARDGHGFTALHGAVWYGNFKVVWLLLKYRASINAKDKRGNTPLDVALTVIGNDFGSRVDPVIVELLRKTGAKCGAELK